MFADGVDGAIVFDSDDLPAGERFACWYELSRKAHIPTRLKVDDEASFRASTRVLGSATLRVSVETVRSSTFAERTPQLISQSDPEQYLIGTVLNGTYGINQVDRDVTIGVGDLLFLDSSRPFQAHYDGGTHLMFWLPRTLLPQSVNDLAPLLAARLPGRDGIGGILVRCLREIMKEPTRYRPDEITRLLNIALELLSTFLAHELDAPHALPPENHEQALLVRIRAFIHQHLGDQGLSPRSVAHAHHISLRRLQQLFATAGTTPAAWIRQHRLERCQRALVDPGQRHHPIHVIAARWGFADRAHFSRLFRATYGSSPSEFRVTHQSALRETTIPLRE